MASKTYIRTPYRIINGKYESTGKSVYGLIVKTDIECHFEYFDEDCDEIGKIKIDDPADVDFGRNFEVYHMHKGFISCERYEKAA